ncbi:MAG: hypothetical protein E7671_05170 [Ruminococcaceae bacterium]|nr:hypothetical protein [Oscillospiraceae bacterium]
MKNIKIKKLTCALLFLLIAVLLASCAGSGKKIINTANLNLDIGIGISHFDNESDFPAPAETARLDVYASKIIIREAYGDQIIETPLIYNNSTTAHPRMQLAVSGNRMYIIYCPDISLPNLQIASTDNGGETWIQSTLSLDRGTVGTIDSFTASFWSTQSGALIIANGMVDTFIYFTTDAGKTWQSAESAPPSQNWHDSFYRGVFLSSAIGFVTYNYYSYPPAEPQVYFTLDGSASWNKLDIKVPQSVMQSYSLAGTPFYDGEKINIPIELYDAESQLAETVYYVSYDFGQSWGFYADENDLEQIIYDTRESWFAANRPKELADINYFFSECSLYSSFRIDDNVRIDAYKLVAAYDVEDWSSLHLTANMYFDENAYLYYKEPSGFPILLFAYEGDVFEHTYYLIGSCSEEQYMTEGENHLGMRLYEDVKEQNEVKQLFADAKEAYSWFTGFAKDLQFAGTAEYNGTTYEKVDMEEISSTAQLSDYLSGLFSSEIVEELMNKYVTSKDTPLFIDGDDGLYRYGGYASQFSYDIDVALSISEISSESATLSVAADTVFYGEAIKFTYDCEVFRDSDGKWKMKTFILPAIKLEQVLSGKEEDVLRPDDKTEFTITNIAKWDSLKFTGTGGAQIRQFLEAFIFRDDYALSTMSAASDRWVFSEYAALDILEYSISKVYTSGQSRILFEYRIGTESPNATPQTTSGTHSFYVTVGQNGVYLSDATDAQLSSTEKFLSDYFSSTLEYTILDCDDLSYSQNYDVTDFLIRRLGGKNVSENSISNLAYTIFGASGFIPCAELMNEDGTYSVAQRGARGIDFDVISESISGGETSVTVQFYADMSRLVGSRTVVYKLRPTGTDYEFVGSHTAHSTDYKVYKINS